MFGEIICEVVRPLLPVNAILSLANTIAYPIETHVDSAGTSLLNRVVGYSMCDGVVCLDGGCWLWPTHFNKGSADGTCLLPVVE